MLTPEMQPYLKCVYVLFPAVRWGKSEEQHGEEYEPLYTDNADTSKKEQHHPNITVLLFV